MFNYLAQNLNKLFSLIQEKTSRKEKRHAGNNYTYFGSVMVIRLYLWNSGQLDSFTFSNRFSSFGN
jgi:hypothetical protein